MASYDRALVLRPDAADAHFNRGKLLMARRRPAEALACFERALAVDSSYTPAQEGLKNVPAPEQPVMGKSNG